MMPVRTEISSSPLEAAEACARFMAASLDNTLSAAGRATMAISGGTGARILFEKLAATRFDWAKVHIFWVDERVVPPTDERSNYAIAAGSFLIPAKVPKTNTHRIHGELMPDAAARTYASEVRTFFGLSEGELPVFDLMHLGLGENAHTASLFPGSALLNDRTGIAAAARVEADPPWRVTLLPGVIVRAAQIAMFCRGSGKAEAVRSVFKEPVDLLRYPAQLTRLAPAATWFIDHAAAALLSEA